MANVYIKIYDERNIPSLGQGPFLNPIEVSEELYKSLKLLGYNIQLFDIGVVYVKNLGMNFPKGTTPNLGSIQFDRNGRNIHLLNKDLSKLNDILTRNNILNNYHAKEFIFKTGDLAYIDDAHKVYMYNSSADTWFEWCDSNSGSGTASLKWGSI